MLTPRYCPDLAGIEIVRPSRRILRARLRPEATLVEAVHGDIPETWLDFPASAHLPPGTDLPRDHAHPFRTWLWRDDRPFDRDRLLALLGRLPGSVLRVKGWCRLGPAGDWRLVNYAGGRWNLTPAAPPAEGAALVLIGTPDLPAPDALTGMLAAALL
jgi:G3E family GTPase